MSVTGRVWDALRAIIKLEDHVTREAEAMKMQQSKTEKRPGCPGEVA